MTTKKPLSDDEECHDELEVIREDLNKNWYNVDCRHDGGDSCWCLEKYILKRDKETRASERQKAIQIFQEIFNWAEWHSEIDCVFPLPEVRKILKKHNIKLELNDRNVVDEYENKPKSEG